jgi:hypothetical protein
VGVLITLLFALFLALPARAAETIDNFTSSIVLGTDGSVEVTETIEVNAEGDEIRHGIYRDIPTELTNPDGSTLRAGLDVRTVSRDGHSEPYAIEGLGSGFKRIRIGDADTYLDYGVHRYTIVYAMTRMGRRFPDHDELFWNVTGNYWDFPIRHALASITLPDGAVIANVVGYTGRPGSTEQDVRIVRTSDNTVEVRATRTLPAGEGMSVAVAFQPGILAAPSDTQAVIWWLSDHRNVVLPGIAVFLVLLYNLFAWSAVGRDPAKGTIIPLFHPPEGFSPPLVHYINKMGWQKGGWTAFTAAIFDLGVKGLVSIDNTAKKLRVSVTGKKAEKLPDGEKVVYGYFSSRGSVTVDTTNGPAINTTRGTFVKTIESENRLAYFHNNMGYVGAGFALSVICLGVLVLADVLDPMFLMLALVGGIAIGLFSALFSGLWGGRGIGRFIVVVWVIVAGGNLLGGLGSSLGGLRIDPALVAAISIVVINVVFAVLMRAPTVQGRKVMDQIDGFKMYLETAEKNRLNINGEPPMTISRFEAILPYAIALGVEKPWSEHFEGELGRNAVAGASAGYTPIWYTGRDFTSNSRSFSNAVSSVASGMSAAMISAQPSSSSGSGFGGGGGGGGSGGGGGGGGGGGW